MGKSRIMSGMSYDAPPTDAADAGAAGSADSALSLDLDQIREQFPALSRMHRGRPVAYFDGPGGTQVPRSVVEAMTDYLFHHNANTHWRYPTSAETDAALDAARVAMADLLHASPAEIAFGQNMTSLTFHLSRTLARQWAPGDEIIVTELDHHGNVDPWRHAAQDRGLVVQTVRVRPETGELDWDDLVDKLSSPRAKLLAIGAAANAIGTISDVKRAARLARAAGALVFIDAVHYAPHALIDVRDLDCDFLACSVYKFYGPHIGVLYGKRALIEGLDVPKLRPAPDEAPERLETGTQSHEAMVGARAAVDFLASIGSLVATRRREPWERSSDDFKDDAMGVETATSITAGVDRRAALARSFAALHTQGEQLFTRLWGGLQQIPGVKLYGPEPGKPRTPTVGFTVAGHTSDQVAEALAEQAVFVSNGNFYAMTLVERLGVTDGLVRAGCACYTTVEEVERLVTAVRQLVR
jgi:cysteine desulfurase family protein (TIGR01976 family)